VKLPMIRPSYFLIGRLRIDAAAASAQRCVDHCHNMRVLLFLLLKIGDDATIGQAKGSSRNSPNNTLAEPRTRRRPATSSRRLALSGKRENEISQLKRNGGSFLLAATPPSVLFDQPRTPTALGERIGSSEKGLARSRPCQRSLSTQLPCWQQSLREGCCCRPWLNPPASSLLPAQWKEEKSMEVMSRHGHADGQKTRS
jgi:hypothetical protein